MDEERLKEREASVPLSTPFGRRFLSGVKLPPKTQKPYSRVIAAGRAAGHED